MLCWERHEISLTVRLVNCHDVTGRIFDRLISLQTGITNQGNTTFRKSRKELYSSLLKVAGEGTLNAFVDIGVRNLNNQKFKGQGGSKERARQSFEGKQS